MALSRTNPWGRRMVKDLPNIDIIAKEAKKIEDRFEKDTENI